jgi:hypothetical protein
LYNDGDFRFCFMEKKLELFFPRDKFQSNKKSCYLEHLASQDN